MRYLRKSKLRDYNKRFITGEDVVDGEEIDIIDEDLVGSTDEVLAVLPEEEHLNILSQIADARYDFESDEVT